MKPALFALPLLLLPAAEQAAPKPAAVNTLTSPKPDLDLDPLERYAVQTVEGWKVLVNKDFLKPEHCDLREQTLRLLGDHLYRITRVVPSGPLGKMRAIPIWVERAHPRHPCMCYHVSPEWLRGHGMNPRKAGGVEIANAQNFLTWTREQPWMVLHELAHAYHHQVLGLDHAGVRACFDAAVASKTYEAVLHFDGQKVKAYALTNPTEYFAETTESFFGTNDFYPFVRAELRHHDPRMEALLAKVWEVSTPARD